MSLEIFVSRFPNVGKKIMDNLDHVGLVTFVETSRELSNYAKNERAFWIQKIQELVPNEEFKEDWNAILTQCEPRMLEKITKSMSYGSNLGPMKMAVHSDDSELYQHCSARLQNGTFDSALWIKKIQEMVTNEDFKEDWMEVTKHFCCRFSTGTLQGDECSRTCTKQCKPRMLEKITEALGYWSYLLDPMKIAVHSNDSELYQHFSARIQNGTINSIYDPILKRTALHVAAEKDHRRIVSFILKNTDGKAFQPQDISGWTPLHLAANRGRSEVCKLFVKFENVDMSPNLKGLNPLHLAAQQGHVECWNILNQETDCRDHPDAQGNTPLHLAALNGRCTLVKTIISNLTEPAAAVKMENNDGMTPLDLANENGNEEMMLKKLKERVRRFLNRVLLNER